MRYQQADVDAMLPLQIAEFHVLLALSADDRHGYGIIHDVESRTGGALRMSPGTLYRTVQRLVEERMIEELRRPSGPRIDPRRRYYRITDFGRAVVTAEAQRLSELVRLARGVLRERPQPS